MQSSEVPITKTIYRWLDRINKSESWLKPKLSEMSDWDLILERDILINRLSQEVRAGGLIVVCSDYDVDGISSGCIITDCVRQCGGRVQMLVSSRFGGGGYGLSDVMVDRVLALSPVSLVVTTDFGGNDHDRIQRLKDNGILTCVIDHHVTPLASLPSYAFLNPNRVGCQSTFKSLCSGGLALSVAGGILKELGIPKSTIDPMQWVDLAGCASIADVVPLTFDNRAITRKALELISNTPRPGFQALLELSNIQPGTQLSARDVAFKICPALNSPGRLGSPDIIVDLLLSKDIDEARRIATTVKEIWDKRRLITEIVTDECIAEIEDNGWQSQPALVVGHESWGHGIVGISAARLVDKYKVPVCVIGSEGRGSLRGPPGSRLYDALVFSKDALLVYGGHQQAAGCRLDFTRLNEFRETFCRYFRENAGNLSPVNPEENILDLDPQDQLMAVVNDLALLEPTGQANPKPKIRIQGKVKEAKAVKGNHLKLTVLIPGNRELGCFAISMGDRAPELINKTVTVIGDLRKNVWNGRTRAEMFVDSITS